MKEKQEIERVFALHQSNYIHYGKRSVKDRKTDLKKLEQVILKYREDIAKAVNDDFRKPRFESDLSEVYPTVSAIRHTRRHLARWASIEKVKTPIQYIGTQGYILPEPKGSVLIIAPWNFPFMLCMEPLISAIAAGNCVVVKPSESTPNTARIIEKVVRETFPEEQVSVIQGDGAISAHLCSLPFHHIFFTGGTEIGKQIMAAAAPNLTSVTLELGGKSPGIVDATANLKSAAARIAQGRLLNSGQVCIAVDYVIAEKSVVTPLIEQIRAHFKHIIETDQTSLSSMVHERHYKRMVELTDDAKSKGAEVIQIGIPDEKINFFPPTLILNPSQEMLVLQEEIFGPILPIVSVPDQASIVSVIESQNERPLAFYIFSSSKKNIKQYLNHSRAGSTGINDVIVQFSHPNLPFGGTNHSGLGKAHGKAGFDAFTNERSIIKSKTFFSAYGLVRPPYTPMQQKLINLLIRWF